MDEKQTPLQPDAIGEEAPERDSYAEMIRRENLSAEGAIRSIGFYFMLVGILALLPVLGLFLSGILPKPDLPLGAPQPEPMSLLMKSIIGGSLLIASLFLFGIGIGLRKLDPNMRAPALLACSVGVALPVIRFLIVLMDPDKMRQIPATFIGATIGTAFFGFILYTLLKRRTGFLFSLEYENIVAKTAYVKYRWSTSMWVMVVLLLTSGLLISGLYLWST